MHEDDEDALRQGNIIYPPPSHPIFGPEGIFKAEGAGSYFEAPAAGILYAPPSFIRPPTARRVFSGVGAGFIKFGTVVLLREAPDTFLIFGTRYENNFVCLTKVLS